MVDNTPVPAAERVTVSVDVPRDVVDRIDRKANEELLSRRSWMRRALLRASREGEAAA
jgi:hypothetical protein